MLFDLINASTTFQVYINKILTDLIDVFCVIYLDDILIYFDDRNTHVKHVWQILKSLQQHNLYAKLSKCDFFVKEVEYLDFIINRDDIAINIRQMNIIKKWSKFTFFKNIQIFLNFANFYRRFIHKYSRITLSLINFLKKMQAEVKKNLFISRITREKSLIDLKKHSRRRSFCSL